MADPALDVATPERVSLELPIAGVGSRALAWGLDAALIFVVVLVAYFGWSLVGRSVVQVVQDLSTFARVVALLAGFFAVFVYDALFEQLWNGQTPGKRLMHIRVVRLDGAPVTPLASAVRNLLRIIDVLPMCYPVGIISMLVDPRHRRLGDLVAGTVLVREEAIDLGRYEQAASAAATALSTADLELVTDFLARSGALEPGAREPLARQLAVKLGLPADEAKALGAEALVAWLTHRVASRG
jgi:uncharacterized RDD family membrane protein YckC